MELNKPNNKPDNTAASVALWRAMHVQVDAPPHILEDDCISFFSPDEMLVLAHETGFKEVSIVSTKELATRYFTDVQIT